MFQKARLKLTAFYLLIIMTVSIAFSVMIYRGLTLELARGLRMQARRMAPREDVGPNWEFPKGLPAEPFPLGIHQEVFEESQRRIAVQLILINLGILVFSGGAGYFLAGKTLKPIADMVDEQKRFIADASHELRTPLTAMKAETEVVLRDRKLDLRLAKQQLASNLEEVDKLKSLTDYFLRLNKYQDFKSQLAFEKFNFSLAVEEACERLKSLAEEKKIRIIKKTEKVLIEADKTSLIELATILLENAIKYSHKEGRVIISIETRGGNAFLRVEDFGIGIKALDLPHIFDRFYRANSSRTKNIVQGYGLGLALAKSIVELHKGKIAVESVAGEGSTFMVVLPLKQKCNPIS